MFVLMNTTQMEFLMQIDELIDKLVAAKRDLGGGSFPIVFFNDTDQHDAFPSKITAVHKIINHDGHKAVELWLGNPDAS